MKNLRLVFEETSMLDLRKTLFKKGLTPQQFFSFITNLVVIKDSRILEILEEAREYASALPSTRANNLNADEIYSLIESSNKQT